MRGNEHKFDLAKFQLDIREKIHKEDEKTLEQVAQRDWWIPILVDIAKYLAGQGSEELELI